MTYWFVSGRFITNTDGVGHFNGVVEIDQDYFSIGFATNFIETELGLKNPIVMNFCQVSLETCEDFKKYTKQ